MKRNTFEEDLPVQQDSLGDIVMIWAGAISVDVESWRGGGGEKEEKKPPYSQYARQLGENKFRVRWRGAFRYELEEFKLG